MAATFDDFRDLVPGLWKHLNLNYKIVAHINEQTCIGCDLCHTCLLGWRISASHGSSFGSGEWAGRVARWAGNY